MAGGIIPPDGRPPQASGVGKNAKRHDLEAPATPGLSGSDLQYGDVSMLEAGQAVAPIAKQVMAPAAPSPAGGRGGRAGVRGGGPGPAAPDPLEFATRKLGGTLGGRPETRKRRNMAGWSRLLQSMQTGNMSGALRAAMVEGISSAMRQPYMAEPIEVDLYQFEDPPNDDFLYE